MASDLGSTCPLTLLFGLMEISMKDQEGLNAQCGITNLQTLIDNRARLAHNHRSKTCRLLVACIDYISEREKKQHAAFDDSVVHGYFVSSSPLDSSWEHFLAQMVERARNQIPQEPESSQLEKGSKNQIDNRNGLLNQRRFKDGDVYWVDTEDRGSVSEQDDEQNFVVEDLFGDDSLWGLAEESEDVYLKKLPTLVRVPLPLFIKLYDYQRVGIAWMAGLYHEETGGILGDEMGMGKTMQTLVFLLSLMCMGNIRNALVICPKSNMETTWIKEAMDLISKYKWEDNAPRIVLIGPDLSDYQRRQLLKVSRCCSTKQPHLVITSYPQVQKNGGFQPGNKDQSSFDFIVLDEGHRVKNTKSIARQNIQKISKHASRLMLTGTPFLNDLKEVHSLLSFAAGREDIVGNLTAFNSRYKRAIEAGRKRNASSFEKKIAEERILELQQKIEPYLLQRKKADSLSSKLPPIHQFDVWTRLTPIQRMCYEENVARLKHQLEEKGEDKNIQTCVLPAIHRFREICNHPLLFTHKKKDVKQTLKTLGTEDIISHSAKLRLLIDILHHWRSKGFKALVFSEYVGMLDIIQHVLTGMKGINTCRIDGATSQKRRKDLIDDFNFTGSRYNVMLLSIQAGGEGLTLTGSNKSVIFDPAWNQATPDQAAARIHRPGQTKETECIHFTTAGTVEEKMVGKQIFKGSMDRTILGTMGDGSARNFSISHFDRDELTKLFELEPDGVCESLDRFAQHGTMKHCSINKSHRDVVGISQRSKVYSNKK